MERWKGKVAIVTGASAGIGAAVAEQLVDSGLKVVGLARRKEKLDELSKKLHGRSGKFYGVKTDICKEEDILKAFNWAKENLGPIHVLINNAGLGRPTSLIEGNTNDFKTVLDTNVLGLTICTREAVKDMNDHKVDGHIIHVNSVAGHYVPQVPKMNIYPASKHAVTALTETLRYELNLIGSKIKITSISPGLVDTDLFSANGYLNDNQTVELLNMMPKLESKDVADAILYILGTPSHVQVPVIASSSNFFTGPRSIVIIGGTFCYLTRNRYRNWLYRGNSSLVTKRLHEQHHLLSENQIKKAKLWVARTFCCDKRLLQSIALRLKLINDSTATDIIDQINLIPSTSKLLTEHLSEEINQQQSIASRLKLVNDSTATDIIDQINLIPSTSKLLTEHHPEEINQLQSIALPLQLVNVSTDIDITDQINQIPSTSKSLTEHHPKKINPGSPVPRLIRESDQSRITKRRRNCFLCESCINLDDCSRTRSGRVYRAQNI